MDDKVIQFPAKEMSELEKEVALSNARLAAQLKRYAENKAANTAREDIMIDDFKETDDGPIIVREDPETGELEITEEE